MPLELDVFIPQPDNEIESKWKSQLDKAGIVIEYEPAFDLENQSGFMPLKVLFKKGAIQNEALIGKNLLSGFELDIEEFDSLEYLTFLEDEGEEISLEYNELVSDCDFRVAFYCDHEEDSVAYRLMYSAAAALTVLYNGIMINPETGIETTKANAFDDANSSSDKFESSLTNWLTQDFVDWETEA